MKNITLRLERRTGNYISIYMSKNQDKGLTKRNSQELIVAKIAQKHLEKIPLYILQSVMRIKRYIRKEFGITDLTKIRVNHLINYFDEQKSKDFYSVSFQQTIKDIKNVNTYLSVYKEVNNPPYINFSIQNHRFWNKN